MRESATLEFKSEVTNTFLKTVSAYSNYGEGRNLTFDDLSSTNQDFQFTYLEKKLQEIIGIDSLTKDILRTLGLYTKERHYNNAAALLADKNDFYGIDIARFGDSISYILDRKTFANISVLLQYDQAVGIYQQYYQYEVVDGIERRKVETIPESAYREAVANAIVHRKWDVHAHIRIEMYSDRIEIFSPGGLPAGVTDDDYMNSRVSILRNPILGGVFFRMHYIEQFGTGIRRIKEAYRDNSQKPIFDISENVIHVILPVLGTSGMTEDQEKVYGLMKMGRAISSSTAAQETGFSKSKATMILKEMASKGYVQIMGRGRGTKYAKK